MSERRAVHALEAFESAIRRRTTTGPARIWIALIAIALFLGISIASFWSLPDGLRFRWWALPILICVTTPLTVAANSAEFRVMGAINGHEIGWAAAARLTVVAGMANLLPLPGGVLVRTHALHRRGSSYRHALAANAAAGLAWIGMGCLIIAVLFASLTDHWIATVGLLIAAAACLIGTASILRRIQVPNAAKLFGQLVAVEAVTVGISAARIYFAFRFVGLSADAIQSVSLTASQVIAAAVGIFPSGLGLRELLAGGIGSSVGLTVVGSIAATASDRVTGQLGVGLLSVPLLLKRGPLTDDAAPADETFTTTHLP